MLRLVMAFGVCGLVACAHPAAEKTARTASALALSSAIVAPVTMTTLVLACHGEAFCREDRVGATDEEARTDVSDDCVRHHGSLSDVPCTRDRALATCGLAGEHGPISVFGYQADAVDAMKDLCEQMSGELIVAN